MKEKIVELNVEDISDFKNHPFKINNDLNYEELKNSIIDNGVLVPAIVRQKMMVSMKILNLKVNIINGRNLMKNMKNLIILYGMDGNI